MTTFPTMSLLTPKRALVFLAVLLIMSTIGVAYYRYTRPIAEPTITSILKLPVDSQLPVEINWPAANGSQASVGSVEHGILASEPNQQVFSTASTAKLITVLTILKEKPLLLGEQGPLLTIDERDMALYRSYQAAGGSLVSVELGEQLSQYQMLQGILIRSGNNLADSLALWAFGSLDAYRNAAEALVAELGMTNTQIGADASGLDPNTKSTTDDLTRLGIAAMKHEVIREIVRQPTSNLPVDGVKANTNWMLGSNGVIGIKTGNIPQVGGVFVIASEFIPEGEAPITLVGAVQGEPTTAEAISAAGVLVQTAQSLFVEKTIVKKGDVVATFTTPWGEKSNVIAAEDLSTFGWKYFDVVPQVNINSQTPFQENSVIGTITVGEKSSKLIATESVDQPSWLWRLKTTR